MIKNWMAVGALCMALAIAAGGLCAGEKERADIFFRPAALPDAARFTDCAVFPDGTFWIEQFDAENDACFESRRLMPIAFDQDAAKKLVFAEWPEAHGIVVSDFHTLAKKLSYPVIKLEFLTGHNEDTWRHSGAVVYSDDWTFLFVAGVDADSEIGNTANADANDALGAYLDRVVASLEFAPAPGEWPAEAIPVMLADEGSEEWSTNEIMNALIRIKRELNPGREEGRAAGRTAFRYDGLEMISLHGLAVHCFAFGTDSPEKFTVERHLAADRRGVVYEAVMSEGGMYEPVREFDLPELPNWWGSFRNGDKLLRITSVREGPYSMYFVFALTAGDKTVADALAPFDDRIAFYDSLLFTLSDDGESIEATLDPESPQSPGAAGLSECVGVYFREGGE